MDPVSVGLLMALAGGAGGELGRQTWTGLGALVRRPFGRGGGGDGAAAREVGSGEAELEALVQAPDDEGRAHALSTALAVRADRDTDFRDGLDAWRERARQVVVSDGGTVNNTVSGGTQTGPVLQGRDFSGVTFTAAPVQSVVPVTGVQPGGAVPAEGRGATGAAESSVG
ncbi:hypothetical protein [Streptomyces sp. NPDC056361]|uniref:hypothetical protein n=1 Tax=Streptomyces sp. NPDC056361 TaxID=3345795 RepID=UPI0035E1C2F6